MIINIVFRQKNSFLAQSTALWPELGVYGPSSFRILTTCKLCNKRLTIEGPTDHCVYSSLQTCMCSEVFFTCSLLKISSVASLDLPLQRGRLCSFAAGVEAALISLYPWADPLPSACFPIDSSTTHSPLATDHSFFPLLSSYLTDSRLGVGRGRR